LTRALNLLLVEDSADDAELILLELRGSGFEVRSLRVETGAAMAEALAHGSWDLVLSDYSLPAFGGMEALGTLQASELDIPFILVSGAIGEEVAVAAMKAGAHGYVLKQNLGRLGPAVERELRDGAARREQRQAKEELLRSQERYRALFEHSAIPLSVQDYSEVKAWFERRREQGVRDFRAYFEAHPEEVRACAGLVRIKEGNEARTRFFAGEANQAAPSDLPSIYLDSSWPVFREQLVVLAEGGTTFRAETPVRALGGEVRTVSVHLTVSPGFEGTLRRVLVSFVDITERLQMAAALRDLDRLATKGQMAAYVAHEINNPLAGIKNAFALLEPAIPADHPHRHYADLIKREIDRIAGIIRTMYHLYQPAAADSGEVALQEVFQDIQSLLIPKCRAAGVAIVLERGDPGLRLRTNGSLLRQVIFNLAQNAVEASPRGGEVTLGGRRAAAGTEITVQDQGGGIPPELAGQVFQQGFSTKRGAGMGLGLGLSACKSIVESLGGTLAFGPVATGPGCRFRVSLPQPDKFP
jgi:signal transduction histidine kinase/DNA-binding response OmpR family regulator